MTDPAASVNIQRTPMSVQKRPYRMRRRAELEEQTRRRITESAVSLHEQLGPARTTISAIAEHAGVLCDGAEGGSRGAELLVQRDRALGDPPARLLLELRAPSHSVRTLLNRH